MKEHIEEAEKVLLHTYNRYQVVFDHGDGVYLYDEEGNEIVLNQGKTFVEIVRNQDASKVVISDNPSVDTYIIDSLG